MRRLHFDNSEGGSLEAFLEHVKTELEGLSSSSALLHVYIDTKERDEANAAIGALEGALPGVPYVGSSTTGNIIDGELVRGGEGPHVSVLCDVFEDPATRVEVMQLPLEYDNQDETAAALVAAVGERPWVKAVEMHACVGGADVPRFCEGLSAVRPDIVFFGGAALCPESLDVTTRFPYVFSSAGGIEDRSVAFTLYGGENLHAQTLAITGWKPLGPQFEVTRAERSRLYELDGRPAYEVYDRYLHIDNDEDFFNNGLVFPLSFDRDGMLMIKAPSTVNEDGSLTLTSDVSADAGACRIAYGDPATILESVREATLDFRRFAPQAVSIYTCSARMIYWGPDYVSREFRPFQSVACTTGWFTGSEFARHGADVLQYNVTLVVAGLREGPARDLGEADVQVEDAEFSAQMALVRSLTAFVGTTSAELQEAYEQMEIMAKTDGLTGLANRREIESLIDDAVDEFSQEHIALADQASVTAAPCVIMFDLDDFKVVNDAYGHKAGDDVLKGLGQMLGEVVDETGFGTAGRWGGEEFMVVLPKATRSEAMDKAEEIRTRFAALEFPASGAHTLSLGVAQALPGESADLLCSRADKALYAAKKRGKNCAVYA